MARARHVNILSYNLHFHRAYDEVFLLAKESGADVICLQECTTGKLKKRIDDFVLAANTNSASLGLAIYYRSERLKLIKYSNHHLQKSLYERMVNWNHQRALVVEFHDTYCGQNIFLASFHATHLVASNSLRRRQLSSLLQVFDSTKSPIIVAGDYNYPLFHRGLERYLHQRGFRLHVPSVATYKSKRFIGKFDLISTARVSEVELKVLPKGRSDHSAILAKIVY